MNVKAYEKYLTSELLMGPSCLRILKELLDRSPLSLSPDQAVLDLGCGKGLTSLAIAKEIMETHGGKLTAESEYGKGTTMTMWFPKERPVLEYEREEKNS